MNIVEIAADGDVPGVFAELQALGSAWRPAEDVPWLVYLEAGTVEEISRIPGVRSCCKGRSGPLARLLHGSTKRDVRRLQVVPRPVRVGPPDRLCA